MSRSAALLTAVVLLASCSGGGGGGGKINPSATGGGGREATAGAGQDGGGRPPATGGDGADDGPVRCGKDIDGLSFYEAADLLRSDETAERVDGDVRYRDLDSALLDDQILQIVRIDKVLPRSKDDPPWSGYQLTYTNQAGIQHSVPVPVVVGLGTAEVDAQTVVTLHGGCALMVLGKGGGGLSREANRIVAVATHADEQPVSIAPAWDDLFEDQDSLLDAVRAAKR